MSIVRILPSSGAAHAEVAFAYDREIVGIVRAVRTSRWLPRQKRWRLERTALDTLLAELDRHGITVDLRRLQPPGASNSRRTSATLSTAAATRALPSASPPLSRRSPARRH